DNWEPHVYRTHDYGGTSLNQLVAFDRLGVFSRPLPKPSNQLSAFPDWRTQAGSIEERARAYLDVNCAMCHTPPGFTKIDLRHQLPLDQMWLVDRDPEKPRIGPNDSKLVLPGDPARSELLLRMTQRGPGRMPNLATSLVDRQACDVVRQWIQSLKKH
ncbi:MAG: heme-binding domain-containing protein, partial [Planctomycetes bacterium]|nr:heme-binding domain-containing protein [Planctomycetota bacterium]